MRNFSNQGGGSGRPSQGGGGGRPSGGNRGGYGGGRSGGPPREHRESHGDREHRGEHRPGGGYRGNNPRFERQEHRGEHRSAGGFRGENRSQHTQGGHGRDRHERQEGGAPYRSGPSWVEIPGRTPEEAIEEAARRFNVPRSDMKTEVLEEGSKGFLGIGSKPARVRISLKASAVPSFGEGVLSRLLRGMGMPDKVKVQKDTDGNIVLNIQGPSSGTLIGRHGHTLEALQYLVAKVVQRMTGDERAMVIVDVEDYLERQKDKLKELALSLAEKAKETGVEIPMRPMSSKDRRVVHLTLKEHEHVKTESRGEGLRRKVVIVPKNKAPEASPEAIAAAEAAGNVSPEAAELPSDAQPSPAPPPSPAVSRQDPEGPEPGNRAPVEKEVDDSIGNRA